MHSNKCTTFKGEMTIHLSSIIQTNRKPHTHSKSSRASVKKMEHFAFEKLLKYQLNTEADKDCVVCVMCGV